MGRVLGYVNGGSLYQFLDGEPIDKVDPLGLAANWTIELTDGPHFSHPGYSVDFWLVPPDNKPRDATQIVQVVHTYSFALSTSGALLRPQDREYWRLDVTDIVAGRRGAKDHRSLTFPARNVCLAVELTFAWVGFEKPNNRFALASNRSISSADAAEVFGDMRGPIKCYRTVYVYARSTIALAFAPIPIPDQESLWVEGLGHFSPQ